MEKSCLHCQKKLRRKKYWSWEDYYHFNKRIFCDKSCARLHVTKINPLKQKDERNQEIYRLRVEGKTFSSIARIFEVTTSRVQYIFAKELKRRLQQRGQ